MYKWLSFCIDSREKVLDIPAINRIINQEFQNLEIDVDKVIVYYIDIEDYDEIITFIKGNNATEINVELKDLKNLLHDVVVQRAMGLTIRDTTLAAPAGLLARLGPGIFSIDLVKIRTAYARVTLCWHVTVDMNEF